MKTDLVILNEETIKEKLYYIRSKYVMLDSDLAKIYGYETKNFNRQVKNNKEKFDEDFMFQLTDEEYNYILRCKNFTTSLSNNYGGRRYNPYVFTEEGVYMLMTVLKGELATYQSKALIRIFKSMKDYLIDNKLLEQKYINNLVIKHENKIDYINNNLKSLQDSFNKLGKIEEKNKIFFSNQLYDANSFFLDILNSSKKEIIIIDNYVNKEILDLISKTKKKVLIISKNMDKKLIKKYQSQYDNLIIKQSNEFHDRFIIIDRKILYTCGASFKDLGKKCFAINKISDITIINKLLEKI